MDFRGECWWAEDKIYVCLLLETQKKIVTTGVATALKSHRHAQICTHKHSAKELLAT